MNRIKSWMILGMVSVAMGYAEPGKIMRKKTEVMEKMLHAFQDLNSAPISKRLTALEYKLSEMDWDGLYLGARKIVSAWDKGIPIVVADLERGTARTWPLYKLSVKKYKPHLKDEKPAADNSGTRYGCR